MAAQLGSATENSWMNKVCGRHITPYICLRKKRTQTHVLTCMAAEPGQLPSGQFLSGHASCFLAFRVEKMTSVH